MVTTRVVSGTTVATGSLDEVLRTFRPMLAVTLPDEALAAIPAPPVVEPIATAITPSPAVAADSGDSDNEGTGRARNRFTRPNGETFFARKVRIGDTETTDVQFIRDSIGKGISLLLLGDPGCGKTAAIEAAVHGWAAGLITLVGTANTEAADFVGAPMPQPDGTFLWKHGALARAMLGDGERGYVLYVDEIGRIDPKVLTVLFSVMDGRGELYVPENPDQTVIKALPGFAVISSTNPKSPGVVIDDALLSRFAPPLNYTTDFGIAVKYLGIPREVAALARDMTKEVKAGTAYWAPTMRDLLQWKKIAGQWGEAAGWHALLSAAPEEAWESVATRINSVAGTALRGGWEL